MLRRYWRGLAAAALYTALAVFALGHLWASPVAASQAGSGADPGQSMWFLTYWPWAILHGHFGLSTPVINEPYGVSLMDNTTMAFPALLVSPVTLLAGPVVAYYTAMTLALASSATAVYALLRRLTEWWGAALIGGLAFEVSQYMVGAGSQHLNLAFVPAPPLLMLAVAEVAAPRTRLRPEALGLMIGGLAVAQFFTSSEILLTSGIVGIIVLAAAAVHQAVTRWPSGPAVHRLGRAAAVGGVIAVVLLAYPIWATIAGPQHVQGVPSPTPPFRADAAGIVVPTSLQALAPRWAVRLSSHFVEGNVQENGSYLGLTLVLTVAAGAIRLWRLTAVKVATAVLVTSWLLSLGTSLLITGSTSDPGLGKGLWLPARLLRHLPLGGDIIAVRFSLYTALAAVALLAIVLDRLRAAMALRGSGPPAAKDVVAVLLAVVCLLPLIPEWPYRTQPIPDPAFFRSSAIDQLRPGTNVVLYPFPALAVDAGAPMVWQAQSFMRFRMAGGYFNTGARDPFYTRYSVTFRTLRDVYNGAPPPLTPSLRRQLVDEMRAWRIGAVIADPGGPGGPGGAAFLTELVGRPPNLVAGVDLWTGLTWR